MRQKTNPILTGSFLFWLCLGQSLQATAVESKGVVRGGDYFPLGRGSVWRYSTRYSFVNPVISTVSVKNVTKGPAAEFLVENASPVDTISEIYTRDKDWVLLTAKEFKKSKSLGLIFRPPKPVMTTKPKVGLRWSWSGPGALGGTIKDSMEIAGAETVIVPAGKFTCIKILTIKDVGGMMLTRTDWYAAGVGLVKTVVPSGPDRGQTELISFTVKK